MVQGMFRVGVAAWIGLASVSFSGVALAQPGASVNPQALSLFKEGQALMERGDYRAACPKFEESLRIQRGIGTLYNLAECYEKLGRTASAWRGFREVQAASEAEGRTDRGMAARERVEKLEPTLVKLRIEVPKNLASVKGLEIRRGESTVSRDEWGVALPVDPGTYRVRASLPGKVDWSATFNAERPGGVVVVRVPELPAARSKAEAFVEAGAVGAAAGSSYKSTLVVVGGVTAYALALTGGAFAAASIVKADERDEYGLTFSSRGNPEEFRRLDDQRLLFARVCFGTIIGAGAVGAATIGYWLLAPDPAASPVVARPVIVFGPGGGAATIVGQW